MHLLRSIERYLRESGTKPARFGREAVGDPRLVFDLRRGREPRSDIERRALAWIEKERAGRCGG